MSHKSGYISPNKPLNVRLHPAGKRELLMDMAGACGTSASEVINQLTDWWMGVPGAELPTRPDIAREDLAAKS